MGEPLTIASTEDDRRDALRQPTTGHHIEIEHKTQGRHRGELKDISRTGMRFQAACCFPCGSHVTLYPPTGFGLSECNARIVRQRVVNVEASEGEAVFEYGVQFTPQVGTLRHTWFLTLRRAA